ncbi:unnamed protein product [Adineta ricciae]|uniref:Purple acid phosphatase N-terminal domain-containing protein n=2 Tax=Adineta ricciae TaxID=249248 RepID=A0A815B9F6_ADIRI|nr:unnamed protein product [Adineta ricciae]
MKLVGHLVLFALFIVNIIQCEEHLYVNGPFGKRHLTVDIPSPYNCNRSIGISEYLTHRIQISELQVSSTHYSNNEEIYVSWIPSLNPCQDDFIGAYFVETPLIEPCSYLDFEVVQQSQSNSTWLMINLRHQLEFRYFSRDANCNGTYQFIAKSPLVEPLNYNEPVHIHLAFGDRNDQIYVSYLTNSNQIIPKCQYGFDSSSLNFQVSGTSITYQASDMCEGKANITGPQTFINSGYMHTMLLQDLRPSTIYYYRVGSDEHGWSEVNVFINRPSSIDDEVNLIAYGDMGVSPIQSGAKPTIDRVLTRVITNNVTAILHIGDVSYARGVGALWDAFMSQIEATKEFKTCSFRSFKAKNLKWNVENGCAIFFHRRPLSTSQWREIFKI